MKENIKAPRHWLLWGEFASDRWIPAQRDSNAENVSIWWRHHELSCDDTCQTYIWLYAKFKSQSHWLCHYYGRWRPIPLWIRHLKTVLVVLVRCSGKRLLMGMRPIALARWCRWFKMLKRYVLAPNRQQAITRTNVDLPIKSLGTNLNKNTNIIL